MTITWKWFCRNQSQFKSVLVEETEAFVWSEPCAKREIVEQILDRKVLYIIVLVCLFPQLHRVFYNTNFVHLKMWVFEVDEVYFCGASSVSHCRFCCILVTCFSLKKICVILECSMVIWNDLRSNCSGVTWVSQTVLNKND